VTSPVLSFKSPHRIVGVLVSVLGPVGHEVTAGMYKCGGNGAGQRASGSDTRGTSPAVTSWPTGPRTLTSTPTILCGDLKLRPATSR